MSGEAKLDQFLLILQLQIDNCSNWSHVLEIALFEHHSFIRSYETSLASAIGRPALLGRDQAKKEGVFSLTVMTSRVRTLRVVDEA